MNTNRLPDFLQHMQQAAADAIGFVGDIRGQILISSKLVVRSSWQLGIKAHKQSE